MPAGDEEMIAFRIARADRAAIERLVARGEFRNRSDFFRYAVKTALKDALAPRRAADLDLSMDAVELPDVAAPASGRRATTQRRTTQRNSRG